MELYGHGQRIFGENRVQELLEKRPLLPPDVEWHLIGHLQTNKVKHIVPFIRLIHSADSLKLLQEIEKESAKARRTIDVLLQFHIAQEETKFGLDEGEARSILENPICAGFRHVRICGVMGMASFTDDHAQVRREMRSLRTIFERLRTDFFAGQAHFKEVSMGMSGDWKIAVEEGSTLVRIGSLLFT